MTKNDWILIGAPSGSAPHDFDDRAKFVLDLGPSGTNKKKEDRFTVWAEVEKEDEQ